MTNKIACVYALFHTTTAKFLVGSTIDLEARKSQWKRDFFYKRLPKEVMLVSRNFDDWEFVVMEKLEVKNSKDKKYLRFLETKTIVDHHVKYPKLSLNTSRFGWGARDHLISKSTYYARLRAGMDPGTAGALVRSQGFQRKTSIVDDDGKVLNYTEAAFRLGCRLNTLQKRLRARRRKNPALTSVTLRELLVATRRWKVQQ